MKTVIFTPDGGGGFSVDSLSNPPVNHNDNTALKTALLKKIKKLAKKAKAVKKKGEAAKAKKLNKKVKKLKSKLQAFG